MTGRKSNLNPANSKNGNDEVDEVLFDEDEASSNLGASTVSMSASRSASASASASGSGSGSDEERGVGGSRGGSQHSRRQSRTRM